MSDPQTIRVGFDLGGTKMMAGVFDADYKLLGRERKKTKGYLGPEAGIERVIATIRDALKEAKLPDARLAGIGVGCPGPLDLDEGVLIDAVNLGWKDVHLKTILEAEFGCPATILNDVDAGVYGEYRFGAGQGAYCLLGIFPGTGIGGGCVYRGHIFRGKTQSCMEVGHMPLIALGPRSGAGHRGTLEAVASRLAIAAASAQAAYRGQAPFLMKATGTTLTEIRSGTIADAIKAGDVGVENAVRDACELIGLALGGMINMLAPDVIVLGGGLVEAMPDLFTTAVGESAAQHILPAFRGAYRIVASKLADNAGVMGAAAWQEADGGNFPFWHGAGLESTAPSGDAPQD